MKFNLPENASFYGGLQESFTATASKLLEKPCRGELSTVYGWKRSFREIEMRKALAPKLILATATALILASCAGRTDQAMRRADISTHPDRRCNPALVINPFFLAPNDGVAGAGGPDAPGAGAAAYPDCPVY